MVPLQLGARDLRVGHRHQNGDAREDADPRPVGRNLVIGASATT